MDINGVAAIVTGGASGLGAATARALAKAGAKVALVDHNEAGAIKVADEIGGIGIGCDVSSAEQAEDAVKRAEEAHGPARILVNCAGIAPAKKVLSKSGVMPLDEFRKAIEVNLIGTFNFLRLVAERAANLDPVSESGERGVIINTASVAAYEGQIGQTAYAASKGGVKALTLPAAREFAQIGIRVCCIAPGIFETPMLLGLPEPAQKSLGASVPFPSRLGKPDEYAKLVLAILDNEMLNGETIRLDGALRMAPK
ncbi:SDR family NAD(P)-dependent oxidoreductase [Rhizobium sp. EC-SD404]|uniref:SDR family NAD(P)-dependent oxidoreductase n=1 Tax=Rhizobium sp. EC-SD404 TaxID=2038389 RepID=UPI001254F9B6|nr:SDR family NAD(P)-dependent oxidoreductase [Rhizobium sp. EC-SD404]VVT24960.1 putative enzyme [Rhizobium sp. EC-SD404]